VDGKCFKAHAVNYILYGRLLRHCHDRISDDMYTKVGMVFLIQQWKGPHRKDAQNAIDWALTGWAMWPLAGLTPAEQVKGCSRCPHSYDACPGTYPKRMSWEFAGNWKDSGCL